MQDKIEIRGLLVRGIIGIFDWERENKQDILINLTLFSDISQAGESDDIAHTVDYKTVTKSVIELVEKAKRLTVEALATDVAKHCLSYDRVERVSVTIDKPGALRFANSVGITIERSRLGK